MTPERAASEPGSKELTSDAPAANAPVAFATALPPGFDVFREGRAVLACRSGARAALERGGFRIGGRHSGSAADRIETATESGREALGRVDVDGVTCLVRRFSHGGLARALTGRRFRDPNRPFRELAMSERLRGLGVDTPRVIAARAVRLVPAGYELTLVVERRAGVVDLGALLGMVRRDRSEAPRLRRGTEAAARAIRDLHRVGFVHADLQPANLLVSPAAEVATVLDLDGSRFEPAPLADPLRWRNLGRLWRHVLRREVEYGGTLSRHDRVRFLRAYGVAREALADAAAAIDATARERRGVHALGWRLERRFGRSVDRRAAGQFDVE